MPQANMQALNAAFDAMAAALTGVRTAVASALQTGSASVTARVGDTVRWVGRTYRFTGRVLTVGADGSLRVQPDAGTAYKNGAYTPNLGVVKLNAADVAGGGLTVMQAAAPAAYQPEVDYSVARAALRSFRRDQSVYWAGQKFRVYGKIKEIGADFIRIKPTLLTKLQHGQWINGDTNRKVIKLDMRDLNTGNLKLA